MHYFPITKAHREEMLREIGVHGFRDLIMSIPEELTKPLMELPPPLSELEALAFLEALAEKNLSGNRSSGFAGAGAYEHFIPVAVDALCSRGEFATAYTPYQAEASQGSLQAMFEYQSMICALTGLDVSNASLYDGATALAEACLLSCQATQKSEVVLCRSIHPEYQEVVEAYFGGTRFNLRRVEFDREGHLSREDLDGIWNNQTAAVAVQTPNFFGLVESLEGLADWLHRRNALLIVVTNPLSLGFYRSPGEWGADIACGELQPMGIPLSYGGPYAGFLTTTKALMRRIPGRICGETVDAEGVSAFTLTLQAREQHIRRERASSNICTNQALCALRATVYMALMGSSGLRRVAELNLENAYYLREELGRIPRVKIPYAGAIFNEFVVCTESPARRALDCLASAGICGGVALERWFPERTNEFLVCATETKDKSMLDRYLDAFRAAV